MLVGFWWSWFACACCFVLLWVDFGLAVLRGSISLILMCFVGGLRLVNWLCRLKCEFTLLRCLV